MTPPTLHTPNVSIIACLFPSQLNQLRWLLQNISVDICSSNFTYQWYQWTQQFTVFNLFPFDVLLLLNHRLASVQMEFLFIQCGSCLCPCACSPLIKSHIEISAWKMKLSQPCFNVFYAVFHSLQLQWEIWTSSLFKDEEELCPWLIVP